MNRLAGYLLTTLLAFCALPIAEAQESPDPGMQAMWDIAFLAGRWEGDGWMQRGPERHTFTSTETVESRLDGRVLIIEGLHHGPSGEVVHHAVAVVSYDASRDGYAFRSYQADGKSDEQEADLVDGAFVWGFDTERGRVRFTVRVDGNAWHETGHFSADGESWQPFFQMDLTRGES